ncbi:MAG: hypothetical protein HDQ91_03535 [Desulfovibrio sp.]|nr:hypothetical protein [Desulfovibrio sp.]
MKKQEAAISMDRKFLTTGLLLAAILAGCAKAPAPQPATQTSYIEAPATEARPYVAPQSAPVLPPSYPSLGGAVVQTDTASIPIVQGR